MAPQVAQRKSTIQSRRELTMSAIKARSVIANANGKSATPLPGNASVPRKTMPPPNTMAPPNTVPRTSSQIRRETIANNTLSSSTLQTRKFQTPLKEQNPPTTAKTRPKEGTPKANKTVSAPRSVTRSSKRRPRPAHSGVPIPEKMRKMLEKQFQQVRVGKSLVL